MSLSVNFMDRLSTTMNTETALHSGECNMYIQYFKYGLAFIHTNSSYDVYLIVSLKA